jgi:hypothetical protein
MSSTLKELLGDQAQVEDAISLMPRSGPGADPLGFDVNLSRCMSPNVSAPCWTLFDTPGNRRSPLQPCT